MFGHGEAGHVAASCVVASSGGQGKDRQGAASCVKAVKVGTGGAVPVKVRCGVAVLSFATLGWARRSTLN